MEGDDPGRERSPADGRPPPEAPDESPDGLPIPGARLPVKVEAALRDVIVVSHGRFQGVLLDCSKKNLPFGVSSLHPAFASAQKIIAEDKLFSVSQRFAYQDPDYRPAVRSEPKRRQQKAKMTVRLRPRKVLCSKCKGVCSENSESVVQTRKRKNEEATVPTKKRPESAGRKSLITGSSLIPKLSRLHPDEISNAINGNSHNGIGRAEVEPEPTDDEKTNGGDPFDDGRREESSSGVFSNARTLKISFGEGEGTVVKLPAMFDPIKEESNASDDKAARRAIRKAKKQARRQDANPPSPQTDGSHPNSQRKHKHKVKHKKKKKDEKKGRQADGEMSESETPDENFASIEERDPVEPSGDGRPRNDESSETKICDDSASDWVNCESGCGGVVSGDIVWGKLQGFPWWPGRVIAVDVDGHAKVAWFGSSTSSLVPCHRLASFLDHFKVHYNKKKRGLYKEAVRLATLEAGGPLDPLATDPLASAPNNTLTPLSSPPIDVIS